MAAPRSVFDTLTRLFLRRFLENDLISPGSDRHDTFAIAFAVLITMSVFLAFFLSTKYLTQFIQLPGQTAHLALSDRFFLIAFSMAITALVTLLMWDALGLEARDGAVLGPLPLDTRLIAGAKLAALLAFAAGFSCAFNAAASILYPILLTDHMHVGLATLPRIIGAHAVSVMLASAFSFLAILATRNVLQATVSARWFERVSSIVQTALIVLVISGLLLLPAATVDVSRDWLSGRMPTRVGLLPPLWFTGLYATLEGHTLVDRQIAVPPRLQLPPRMARLNETAAAAYRDDDPLFRELARTAVRALWLATAAAILGFAWNSRRLPLPNTRPLRSSRLRKRLGRSGARTFAPRPAVRAGFSFTLQTLTRSTPHRVAMSAALAFGLTASIVLAQGFRGAVAGGAAAATLPPPGIFAAQFALIAALVGGFRHAARLPATLAASWGIQIAWQGDQQKFLIGCRRAAVAALVAAPLAVLLPIHVALVGGRIAVAHAIVCGLGGIALLDGLFARFNRVAFASPYLPLVSPKVLWPASVAAVFAVPWILGSIERNAFGSVASTLLLMALLAGLDGALTYASLLRTATLDTSVFDDLPTAATQRLGLQDRVLG